MVKRKWLWGKRSSEKVAGETESSGSMSSQSERCSEDQDASKGSPSNTQSPEVTSKDTNDETNGEDINESIKSSSKNLSDASIHDASNISMYKDIQEQLDAQVDYGSQHSSLMENVPKISGDTDAQPEKVGLETSNNCNEDNRSVKLLTEKLSAALLNVSLKDDLVKQHAKVAEEAVAGWEKAENEAAILKQQLETAVQQRTAQEARVSHLDEALKECVRQLRLARDEQERKINQAVAQKTKELELAKTRLEEQLVDLQTLLETSRMNSPDPELLHKLEMLEMENVGLREELELRTIERDLSTKTAETASKQHLESIKKVAKLETECRKLKSLSRNENKSTTITSSYVESFTDSHSDNCSESWASALIAELDQFKTEKVVDRSMHVPSMEIDLMDDFLEMEKLVALPDGKPKTPSESKLRIELEEKIEKLEEEKAELAMNMAQTETCLEKSQVELIETQMKLEQLEELALSFEGEAQIASSQMKLLEEEMNRERGLLVAKSARCEELENKLERVKEELEIQKKVISNGDLEMKEIALAQTKEQLREAEMKVQKFEKMLDEANEEKKSVNSQLDSMRAEVQIMSTQIDSLKEQVHKEWALTVELSAKCGELENELMRKAQELEAQLRAHTSNQQKIKQEDLAVAAGKLADCQKTIASLGSQLKSLATLEDFLIDTAGIPGFSPPAPLMARRSNEPWKLHANHTYLPEMECEPLSNSQVGFSQFASHNGKDSRESPASSSSSTSSAFFLNPSGSAKTGNGFANYFSFS